MSLLHIAGGATEDKLYVEDVFSTYLYTGNGSTQTINNGIDLAGEGGMVWIKSRNLTYNHELYDTHRGPTWRLSTNSTTQSNDNTIGLTAFNSNGFSVGASSAVNYIDYPVVAHTFRRAPKFFDIVTYTGNGVAGRQIPHNLGCEVGMIVIKAISGTYASSRSWSVYHRSTGVQTALYLNTTEQAYSGQPQSFPTAPTTSNFYVGTEPNQNSATETYVAYLFAHDPMGESGDGSDGMIACGSFTSNAGETQQITLGWEPQFVIVKRSDAIGDWYMLDTMRGWDNGTSDAQLYPNYSNAEGLASRGEPNATGFRFTEGPVVRTYIYMAIRRPMKVPKSGTEVFYARKSFNSVDNTLVTTGFNVDTIMEKDSLESTSDHVWYDRLRGESTGLYTDLLAAEYSGATNLGLGFNNGYIQKTSNNSYNELHWAFRRAPKFYDVVCYDGTGVAKDVFHNLTVEPEMIWVRSRNGSSNDTVAYVKALGSDKVCALNSEVRPGTRTDTWGTMTSTSFGVKTVYTNYSGEKYIARMFATLAGVSKVGAYTGNGTTQIISCGFSAGARFVFIRRTDLGSNEGALTARSYLFDYARGIIASNDSYTSFSNTDAEVTTSDSIDPESSGFIVNQVAATDINVNGGSYVFLAIA